MNCHLLIHCSLTKRIPFAQNLLSNIFIINGHRCGIQAKSSSLFLFFVLLIIRVEQRVIYVYMRRNYVFVIGIINSFDKFKKFERREKRMPDRIASIWLINKKSRRGKKFSSSSLSSSSWRTCFEVKQRANEFSFALKLWIICQNIVSTYSESLPGSIDWLDGYNVGLSPAHKIWQLDDLWVG